MNHLSPENTFKIVEKCEFPLTMEKCISMLITEKALFFTFILIWKLLINFFKAVFEFEKG